MVENTNNATYAFAGNQFRASGHDNATPVNVLGIADTALNGLYKAIHELGLEQKSTAKALENAQTEVAKNRKDNEKKHNIERQTDAVRSVASNNRNRAVYAAMFGRIDKATSVFDSLKDVITNSLSALKDIIVDNAKTSLRSYDSNAQSLRKLFLTSDQIKDDLLKGDKARMTLSEMGIRVASENTKNTVTALREARVDTSTLSETQIATITEFKDIAGANLKAALNVAKLVTDQEAAIKIAVQAADGTGHETFTELLNQVNESWFQTYVQKTGTPVEKILQDFQNYSKKFDSILGTDITSPETQAKIIKELALVSSQQYEQVDANTLSNVLGIAADALKNGEANTDVFLKGLEHLITRTDITAAEKTKQLQQLRSVEGVSDDLIAAIQAAINAQQTGEYRQKTIRSEAQNIEGVNQAVRGGKVGNAIDYAITSLNTVTGGLISSISTGINEWFGDSLTGEKLISEGFKVTAKLLTAILMKDMFGALGSGLLNLVKGGFSMLGGSLTTAGSKILSGLGKVLLPALKFVGPIIGVAAAAYIGTQLGVLLADKLFPETMSEIRKNGGMLQATEEMLFSIKQDILYPIGWNIQWFVSEFLPSLPDFFADTFSNLISWLGDEFDALLNFGKTLGSIIDVYVINPIKDIFYTTKDWIIKNLVAPILNGLGSTLSAVPVVGDSIKETLTGYADSLIADNTKAINDLKAEREQDILNGIKNAAALKSSLEAAKNQQIIANSTWTSRERFVNQKEIANLDDRNKENAELQKKKQARIQENSLSEANINLDTLAEHLPDAINEASALKDISTSLADNKVAIDKTNEQLTNIAKVTTDIKKAAVPTIDYDKQLTNTLASMQPKKFATGGIVNNATSAIVGEAGREAILPLMHPNDLANVLNNLSDADKLKIIDAINNDSALSDTLRRKFDLINNGVTSSKAIKDADDIDATKTKLQDAANNAGVINKAITTKESNNTDLKNAISLLATMAKSIKDIMNIINRRNIPAVGRPSNSAF